MEKPYSIVDINLPTSDWIRVFGSKIVPVTEAEFVVLTDYKLNEEIDHPNKIAILLEPKTICPESYSYILNNPTKFKYVLTYDKSLYSQFDNCLQYFFFGSWVLPEDRKIYEKSGNLSMVVSFKTMTLEHRFRHTVFNYVRNRLDYCCGYMNPTPISEIPQKKYRYNIVVENCWDPTFFSEKLLDCFNTGTIPIYKGTPDIGDYFNLDGMLLFNSIDELSKILPLCNEEYYLSKLPSIKDNLERASLYSDWPSNVLNVLGDRL
jgi:hypothetical protein